MLKLENITKKFQETTVLENINLEIEAGEIVWVWKNPVQEKFTLMKKGLLIR